MSYDLDEINVSILGAGDSDQNFATTRSIIENVQELFIFFVNSFFKSRNNFKQTHPFKSQKGCI